MWDAGQHDESLGWDAKIDTEHPTESWTDKLTGDKTTVCPTFAHLSSAVSKANQIFHEEEDSHFLCAFYLLNKINFSLRIHIHPDVTSPLWLFTFEALAKIQRNVLLDASERLTFAKSINFMIEDEKSKILHRPEILNHRFTRLSRIIALQLDGYPL